MKIAKKPKNKKPQKDPYDVMMTSNYLNLSIFLIILHDMYGFGRKRQLDALEGYLAIMQEIADKRATINGTILDAKKITGMDIKEMLDYASNDMYEAWKKGLENGKRS